MINLFFILSCLSFTLGQIGRISFFNQQVNIYVYELLLFILLIFLLIKYRFLPIKILFLKSKIILFFIAYLLFSNLININGYSLKENIISLIYLLRLIFYVLAGTYLYYHAKKDKSLKNINIIIIITFITIIFSIIQYFFYPDIRNLTYLGWDPHYARLVGLFFDASVAAAIYGLLLLYFVFFNNLKNKFIRYLLIIILFIFLGLTFSRTGYIAILLTLIIYFVRKSQISKIFITIITFIIIIFLIPKPWGESVNLFRLFSINARIQDYKEALLIWQKKPIFGYGYNRIRYVKTTSNLNLLSKTNIEMSHSGASFQSSFLIILVTGGVIGVILFLWSLGEVGKLGESGGLGENKKYYILYLSLFSLSDNILLHSFILFLLILFLVSDS